MLTMELAYFEVEPADVEATVAEHSAMIAALAEGCPGLHRADLIELEGGWLHALVWESRATALRAAEQAPSIPKCAAWFSRLRDPRLEHGDVRDSWPAP